MRNENWKLRIVEARDGRLRQFKILNFQFSIHRHDFAESLSDFTSNQRNLTT